MADTTHDFFTPYEQYRHRDGEPCWLLGLQDESKYDRAEVGDLYLIQFTDGEVIEAWPEEIYPSPEE